MILSDNIQRQITRLVVSYIWSIQWFRFQWPWVILNLDFKVTRVPRRNCVRSWCGAICLCSKQIAPRQLAFHSKWPYCIFNHFGLRIYSASKNGLALKSGFRVTHPVHLCTSPGLCVCRWHRLSIFIHLYTASHRNSYIGCNGALRSFNPLIATLKHEWAVPNATAHPSTASVPTSYY